MKEVLVKSFIWILLSMLVMSWNGEFLTRAHSCSIDDSSATIHEGIGWANTGEAPQGLNYVGKRFKSHSEGHLFQIDVAEIEEEHDRLHLNFLKRKLPMSACFCAPFLGPDGPNRFALNKDIAPFLRNGAIPLSERYIIFQVLRI